jgi:hypothetical protein
MMPFMRYLHSHGQRRRTKKRLPRRVIADQRRQGLFLRWKYRLIPNPEKPRENQTGIRATRSAISIQDT